MTKSLLTLLIPCFFIQCTPLKQRQPLSEKENQAWVDTNLDKVMVAKEFSASNGMNLPYRIYVPGNIDDPLPLLIHLHGRGERGTDNNPKIYNNIPLFNGPRSVVSPNSQQAFKSIVLVPQCSDKTENEEWAKWAGNSPEAPFEGLGLDGSYEMSPRPSDSGTATLELIESVISNYNIDKNRVYITGLSMGGFGTWEFVSRRPDLFAAAVPMAGFSDPTQVEKIKGIPIWIFHGDQDEWNPVQGSRTMFQLLTEAGGDIKYSEYEGMNHTPVFTRAWNDTTLLPWIFAQSR